MCRVKRLRLLRGGGASELVFSTLALCEREQLCEQSELTTAGEGLIRSQEVKKARGQAVFFNVILHLLPNFKFVKERSRNRCAMTEQFPVILNLFQDLITQKLEGRQLKPTDVKKSGGQVNLEGKQIGRYEGKLLSVNSQSSNPPIFQSSDKPLSLTLSPMGREDKKEFPSLEGSANEQRAKQRREGGGVAVPLFASEQDRGSKGVGESMPSHSPARGEGNALHPSIKRKAAFTLAEVLITLGIIGVVAAMTLPSLITKNRNKELQAALKKGYSEISQALEFMKSDIGVDILPQDYEQRSFFPIFSKYFRTLKSVSVNGIMPGEMEDGDSEDSPHKVFKNYKTYNKSQTIKTDIFDDGQFILQDGTLILIENPYSVGNRQIFISVDVNGMNKKPNIYGRDLFTFQITNDGKLLPMGADGTKYTDMDKYCSKDSNDRLNGIACAARALNDPDYFEKMY